MQEIDKERLNKLLLDLPESEEMYLGHYVSNLEKKCPTKNTDIFQSIDMLDNLLIDKQQVSPLVAANVRFIRKTLLSKIPIPF